MVPRLHADALVDALALPLPAGRVPVRPTSSPRTARRGRDEPEFELLDTGVFDERPLLGRSPSTTPRPRPTTCCIRVTVAQRRARRRRRCTCCRRCGSATPGRGALDARTPRRSRRDRTARSSPSTHDLGRLRRSPASGDPTPLFCDNETNAAAAAGASPSATPYPKDGINDHVVDGARDGQPGRAPAPRRRCTTGSTVAAGETRRRSGCGWRRRTRRPRRSATSTRCMARPRARGRRVLRRAHAGRRHRRRGAGRCARRSPGCSGASSSTTTTSQRWLERRPGRTAAAGRARERPQRATGAPRQPRRHLDARHVGVPLVRGLGPRVPLRRARPRRPRVRQGAARAAAAASGTCTPTASCRPTSGRSATSTRRCTPGRRCGSSRSTAAGDCDFLERVFHKLLLNFTWWVNRKDAGGQQRLRGRLPRARQHRPVRPLAPLPVGGALEQSDGTAWMAMYCLEPARDRARCWPSTTRPTRTSRRSSSSTSRCIADAMNDAGPVGRGGRLLLRRARTADGAQMPLRVRSMVGLLPLRGRRRRSARETLARLPDFAGAAASGSSTNRPSAREVRPAHRRRRRTPAAAARDRRRRTGCGGCSRAMLDEDEFLSPHGLRALSRAPPGRSRSRSTLGGVDCDASTTSRPSRRTRPVRRQLQLARAGLVPGQLPPRRGAAPLRPLPRRRLHGRVPDRVAARSDARARSPTSSPAGWSAIFLADERRPPAGLRRATSCSRTTRLARPDPVPRVLPRRHRRRARRLAPDRLDRRSSPTC